MSMVSIPPINMGEEIVFHGPKIYEDIKAKPGEKALILMHTVPFEGSVGHLAYNKQLATIMKEGGKIIACRFALSALYGFRETDLLPGVQAIHPLDVLDCLLEHQRAGALVIATWTV